MASYTIQQRVQVVELFYENQCSVKSFFRKLREFYGLHNRSSGSTIGRNFFKISRDQFGGRSK